MTSGQSLWITGFQNNALPRAKNTRLWTPRIHNVIYVEAGFSHTISALLSYLPHGNLEAGILRLSFYR